MINGIDAYQMPPQDGITVAHFLTVADIERSLRFYETVFGSRILSRGDSKGVPGYIQIANTSVSNSRDEEGHPCRSTIVGVSFGPASR
jgi:catechol 2,3-dioxygenase-like lactoylglutathione lyase family enzyme